MNRHDDGDRRRGAPGRLGSGCGARDYHIHFEPNQLGGEGGKPISVVAVESTLDEDVLALDVPELPHSLEESLPGAPAPRAVRRRTPEKAHPIDLRGRLRIGGERPREQAAGQRAQEDPAGGHWISSSARASRDCGMVSPSAFAVFRLMTSSNLVGRSTGRSAGLAPLRILSTYVAARRKLSATFAPYDMRPPPSTNSL